MIRVRIGPAAAEALRVAGTSVSELGWLSVDTGAEIAVAAFSEREALASQAPPALLVLAEHDHLAVLAREQPGIPTDVVVLPALVAELTLRARCLARFAAQAPDALAVARLATTGRVAAAAAHETRNALGIVLANVEFMRKAVAQGRFNDPEIASAAADALDGVQRALAAAKNVLDLASGRPIESVPTAVRDAVDRALALVNPAAFHQVGVDVEIPDVPHVCVDPIGLVQILVNLIANAAEAAGAHGRVLVRATSDRSTVRLSIADSGKGIAADVAGNLFKPFATGKAATGTGLGLAVSRAIVMAAGGSISVGTGPIGGAEFSIILPVAAG